MRELRKPTMSVVLQRQFLFLWNFLADFWTAVLFIDNYINIELANRFAKNTNVSCRYIVKNRKACAKDIIEKKLKKGQRGK